MTTMRDNAALSRYEILEGDTVAVFAEYKLTGSQISFLHTTSDPAFKGRGLGKELVLFALDDVRRRGLSVLPYCPFVRKMIDEHAADYLELVPAERRAAFNLPAAAG